MSVEAKRLYGLISRLQSVLQVASIVGLSPAFLAAFHELTFFRTFSESQKLFGTAWFGNSEEYLEILQTPSLNWTP